MVSPPSVVDIVRNLRRDQLRLIPLTAIAFAVVLMMLFGGVVGLVLPAVAAGMGLAWTFAALVLLQQPLNIITNILPALLLIVGVSNSVHLLNRYGEEASAGMGSLRAAARRTIRHMAVACLLATLTTAVGFMSLTFSASHVLRGLGWQAALGMFLCFLALIGAAVSLLPRLAPPFPNRDPTSFRLSRCAVAIGRWSQRWAGSILVSSGLLIAACIWTAWDVPVDSYLIETYDESHPQIALIRLVEEKLGGFVPLEVELQTEQVGGLLRPETMAKVAAFSTWASARPEVVSVRTYVDLMQQIDARLPGTKRLQFGESSRFGDATRTRIQRIDKMLSSVDAASENPVALSSTGDSALARIHVRDEGTRRTLALIHELEQHLGRHFPESSGVRFRLGGDAYLGSRALDGFIRDMFKSLLGASIVIFVIVGLLYRSVRVGLISILPNVTPLFLDLGLHGASRLSDEHGQCDRLCN